VEGREGNAADNLINKALDEKQREMVCGVAIDMSAPYISPINPANRPSPPRAFLSGWARTRS
jgi:hypothetical protein